MRFLLTVIAVAAAVATDGVAITLPDPRTGKVDGVEAVLYWPGELPKGAGDTTRPLASATGCTAHLVPQSDPESELTYPCGQWFVPPDDKYTVWLETAEGISPTQYLLNYRRKPFHGRGLPAIVPVVKAGTIGIPVSQQRDSGESVRLFSTRTEFWWSKSAWVFDRRLRSREVRMPAGDTIVVGRFDRRTNDAIALSRPVTLREGETQRTWPVAPKNSDVLVILRVPPEMQGRRPAISARLTLDRRDPDVLVKGGNRIIAIWYDVDAPRAQLAFESDAARWDAREIRLTPGKVTTIRESLRALPSAQVSILAPVDANIPDEMLLDVVGPEGPLRSIKTGAGTLDIAELPASRFKVVLSINEWEWEEELDLTSTDQGHVVFELEPLSVRGTVFHGDEPSKAEITFRNGEDRWVAVATDDRGRYETTLWWRDVQTIRVRVDGKPPFLDPFREILQSGVYDFHVPRTDFRVRVRDAQTGRGIEKARVSAGNVTDGGLRLAQHVVTDAEGVAVLPPLRDGQLVLGAYSERYAAAEPVTMVVDRNRHELDISLEPLPITGSVRVTLARGEPAAGCEVWALDQTASVLWSGRADDDGALELPELPSEVVFLVRHPRGASCVQRSRTGSWRLEAPAAPLTISVDPRAPVAVWLDGVRLAGATLTFAAWSGPAADPSGRWTARNLPPRPLQVVAGPIDALAMEVPYPWPPHASGPR